MSVTLKAIVHIRDAIDMGRAISGVEHVIAAGLISADGKSYCYHTVFRDGVHVSTDRPRSGSDTYTFYVYRESRSAS